jgi:hypothetical protein
LRVAFINEKVLSFFLLKVSHPFAVAVLKETVYWDDWTRKAVFQADKNSGTSISILKDNMPGQSLENLSGVWDRASTFLLV